MQKNLTYSCVFNPYSDILKHYSGVFLEKKFYNYQVWEPYSGVFKTYSDVLKPYSGIFLQLWKLKLDFHVDVFPHHIHPLTNRGLKTQVLSWNSSFRH